MWCVAQLDEEYIARMEDVLAVYEKPLSERADADRASRRKRSNVA
jgi:hypothetical protein